MSKTSIAFISLLLSFNLYGQQSQYHFYLNKNLSPSDSSRAVYNRSVIQLNDSIFYIVDKRLSNGTLSLKGTIKIKSSGANLFEFNKGTTIMGEEPCLTKGEQLLHGEIVTYYENGTVESEGTYINNKKDGLFNYYYESGQIKEALLHDESLKAPKYLIVSYFDSLETQLVTEGNGFYERSTKMIDWEKGLVRNGYKHGEWKGRFLGSMISKNFMRMAN